MADEAGGFLSRWARRKEAARAGATVAPEPVAPATSPSPLPESMALTVAVEPADDGDDLGAQPVGSAPATDPAPTMADAALLGHASDYSRFVASGVDEGVKRAAMKKLFADPHFNVMDGLDTYIDDYGLPDPIPLAMLRRMSQSKVLRLFDDDDEREADQNTPEFPITATAACADEPLKPPDDDPDLRLQQDDAAGRPGPDQGAGA